MKSFNRVTMRCSIAVLLCLAAAACSNQSGTVGADSATSSTAATQSASTPATTFGDLPSPCGPGSAKIADGENGGSTLKLGTANDHGADVAPGTTEELLDAATAFAKWCNAQGGIEGLKIESVDLDGKLFQVPAAIERACSTVFAMVGGGWVFDQQQFPRFAQCKMVSFPGNVTSTQASRDPNTVQGVPSSNVLMPYGWWQWAADTHAQDVKKTAIIYAEDPSIATFRDGILQQMAYVGIKDVKQLSYALTGEANWAPFAQSLKASGIQAVTFIGSAGNYALLAKAMTEIGYKPDLVLNAANFYSDLLVQPGNVANVEGMYVQTIFAPFQEAGKSKALQDYEKMMSTYNPKGLKAQLGMSATSALLLAATAAKACILSNANVLERRCMVVAARKITSWTGGGLHAASDPATGSPPKCVAILQVKDGKWVRVFPQLGSADDSGNGYHCYDPGLLKLAK